MNPIAGVKSLHHVTHIRYLVIFFPQNKSWHFIQIVFFRNSLNETSYLFCDEKGKSFKNVVCSYLKFKLSAYQRHNLKPKNAKFMSASFLVGCLLKNITSTQTISEV